MDILSLIKLLSSLLLLLRAMLPVLRLFSLVVNESSVMKEQKKHHYWMEIDKQEYQYDLS